MNIFSWKKELLLNMAEGEGAGGGASSGASDGGKSPAPQNDMLSRFEERLTRMSQQIESQDRARQTDETKRKIEAYGVQLADNVRNTDAAVSTAEEALADAYDNGEGIEIAKAQRALTEAVNRADAAKRDVNAYKQKLQDLERRDGGSSGGNRQPSGEERDTTNLNAWKNKHASWYGVDAEMTKASHEIDRQIREAGVISVGSKEYFDAVDRQMNQRFPDRFGGTPNTATPSTGGNPQSQSRDRGRIQQSIADGWRRMGINVDDPKTLERMVKNREKLVDKGILPQEPVRGAVRVG